MSHRLLVGPRPEDLRAALPLTITGASDTPLTAELVLIVIAGRGTRSAMGASGWSYFVPYDTDPVAALRALHAQVRKSGKYYKGGEEEGTHSILDVNKVAPAPVPRAEKVGFGVVAALPDDELVVILGTARPTRATIEAKQDALQSIRKRWSGTYIVVYENDAPKELFFTGFSGD